ncbi:HMA2 domain-containing protein [Anaerovibrio sp.]|uniref:HMA2 domain-containing protein n=1 Tax=Anaerovibrio sp. TaxID=1872532 RepID=UPI003F18A39A
MSFMSGIMMGASIGSTLHEAIAGRLGKQGPSVQSGAGRSALAYAGAAVSGQVPEFALVSSLSGRRRYRMAALVGNTTLCRYLEERLTGLSGIRSVKANDVTGSLLLEYSGSEEAMDSLMEGIRQRLVPVESGSQAGAAVQPAAPSFADGAGMRPEAAAGRGRHVPTLYARSWSSTGAFLNRQVRRLTCNSFDISALISLFFLLRGIRKMLVYGQRPSGPSMIWWALHLMKGWRG